MPQLLVLLAFSVLVVALFRFTAEELAGPPAGVDDADPK